MADLPRDERSGHERDRRLRLRTLYVASAALAIAVGQVVYAFFRDHVFD